MEKTRTKAAVNNAAPDAAAAAAEEERLMQNTQAEEMQQIINEVATAMQQFSDYEDTHTSVERTRLKGVSMKNFGFIQTVYNNMLINPNLVPAFLNQGMFAWAIDDYLRKKTLAELLATFLREVQDSLLTSGNDAYNYALMYYNSVRDAAKMGVPGAEAAYTLLSPYFKKGKRNISTEEPTKMQVERDVRALLRGTKDGKIVIENERPDIVAGKRKVIDEISNNRIEIKTVDDVSSR